MPKTLIVPGVSVSAQFDVVPPLPARSGILGCVGVVDRHEPGVRGAKSRQELLALFGPATPYSLPEAFTALGNGVSEVVVSPVNPSSGAHAELVLTDDEGDAIAKLRARAAGPWGNRVAIGVTRRLAADGKTVRNVRIQVFLDGSPVETHDGLIFAEGSQRDFFAVINRDSSLITAIDAHFETDLPARDADLAAFKLDEPAVASFGTLRVGGADLIRVEAPRKGRDGDRIAVHVTHGRALVDLVDPDNLRTVRVRARKAGTEGVATRVEVIAAADGSEVELRVLAAAGQMRSYAKLTSLKQLFSALEKDPDVLVERAPVEKGATASKLLPRATAAPLQLNETRTLSVALEGAQPTLVEDFGSAKELLAQLASGVALKAALVAGADEEELPDVERNGARANDFYLHDGRDAGPARIYASEDAAKTEPLLELVPAPKSDATRTRLRIEDGSRPGTVRITAGVMAGGEFQAREEFDELVMDPDSDRYLPDVLEAQSVLLRAVDRYLRVRASQFPLDSAPLQLKGGRAPTLAAYEAAIAALEAEESVDLLLAGLQGWGDETLDGLAVQRAMVGHAKAQADAARPRVVIGSIPPAASAKSAAILDHSAQLADRRFVLVAPAGNDGALAGLLGNLEFFQSATFKTVAQLGGPLVRYTDSELDKLVGPEGNVCVIQSRRGRGTICLKAIATDGFQISVTRVADRCIRDVKAIADRFIGELNNADSRNALKQMIVANFAQLERDGALVPSVDGKSPAFQVEVYGSQEDTAAGIVRVDIAVRPVRAIDYVYATIRVKN